MRHTRRSFVAAAGAAAVTGGLGRALAQPGGAPVPAPAGTPRRGARGMARNLTLLTLVRDHEFRLGVRTSRGILDVKEASARLGVPAPATMDDLLQEEQGPSLETLVAAATAAPAPPGAFLDEARVEYGPVVTHPEKIVCAGVNYPGYARELGFDLPDRPILYGKYNNTLNRHRGTVRLPVGVARQFDHEVELVIVMGRDARNVSVADALSYVAGYCTGNGLTARDLQYGPGVQWMAGKTLDQFSPLGPYLVTSDQLNPDRLELECRVNGQRRQSGTTRELVFGCRELVSYASRLFTLRAGDLIFTGTPQGVVQGRPEGERAWLKPGDEVACSVEKLGELRFTCI